MQMAKPYGKGRSKALAQRLVRCPYIGERQGSSKPKLNRATSAQDTCAGPVKRPQGVPSWHGPNTSRISQRCPGSIEFWCRVGLVCWRNIAITTVIQQTGRVWKPLLFPLTFLEAH